MILNPKTKKDKHYIIYTRCSTDDQAQGDFTTLDAQAHHCKNMIDAFGYELANFGTKGIVNDDGSSGKDLNRPGIQSILKDIHNKKSFDGVIFFRLDRLTRNPRDLYALIDLFRDHEIDFISVRENLDSSTAIGRVVIGILGLLSAFERELTGERAVVDELFILTQPAHLQKQFSDKLSAEERDVLRADMVRDRLKNVSRPSVKPPSSAGN